MQWLMYRKHRKYDFCTSYLWEKSAEKTASWSNCDWERNTEKPLPDTLFSLREGRDTICTSVLSGMACRLTLYAKMLLFWREANGRRISQREATCRREGSHCGEREARRCLSWWLLAVQRLVREATMQYDYTYVTSEEKLISHSSQRGYSREEEYISVQWRKPVLESRLWLLCEKRKLQWLNESCISM